MYRAALAAVLFRVKKCKGLPLDAHADWAACGPLRSQLATSAAGGKAEALAVALDDRVWQSGRERATGRSEEEVEAGNLALSVASDCAARTTHDFTHGDTLVPVSPAPERA
jgi:hypothetical protein